MRDPLRHHLGRRLQRSNWDAWDPTLISECVFATANIFSSLKLVHIFTVNPYLGPLKISLGRMVIDILKFFLVYCLVLFAFACGLNQLMWYYASMRQRECEQFRAMSLDPYLIQYPTVEMKNLEESCDPKYRSCANLFNTLETLFWAMFGLVDLNHFVLKEPHILTEWTGKTIFGSYSCCSVIVLLNMLIAMMSNSFQYISNQADIEWKFARSKLWIEYFDDTATLPPPFNMIPSPKSFYYGLQWICDRFCHFSRRIQQGKQKSMRNQRILKVVNKRENNYRFVTRNLVKRYIAQMQRCKQRSEGVSEDDVNEIKQDISAFRYELLGILRSAGFSTGHADVNQRAFSRSKKRSAMAERRLKSCLPDTFNIPMPESYENSVNNGTTDNVSSPPDIYKALSSKISPISWSHKFKKLTKKVSFQQASPPPCISNSTFEHGHVCIVNPDVIMSKSLDQSLLITGNFHKLSSDTDKDNSDSLTKVMMKPDEHCSKQESKEAVISPRKDAHSAQPSDEHSKRRRRLSKQKRHAEDTVLDIDVDDTVL
ncbi:hypothetical protein AB6A40_007217 [Gnathostoma spinigerum]|uniref:Ion transport domain-containing protein n=1 Tax=Gnathostoma spinigerum TaxID=75299 RepID=A0ABD6EKV0_9BILA